MKSKYVNEEEEKFPERLVKDPYNYIRNYYESVYLDMGKKVFSILSLVIPSLILPDITHKNSRNIKSGINFLLIAPPGTAKSSLGETFAKLAYNSFPFESITDSKFYSIISQRDFVSLVIGDVFKVFSDKILTKTMENVLGDEQKISRLTQRTDDTEKKIKAVAFLAGTPNSLTSIIQEGILFRTSVCLVFHDEDEHEEIGEYISSGAFEKKETKGEEEKIMEYYQELLKIQTDRHTKIKPIKGYVFDKELREQLIKEWKPLVKPMVSRTKFAFFRELHQGMRYACSHCFLNIFNREIVDNKIVITQEDVDVAKKLMKNELETKYKILTCSRVVSEEKLKTVNDLSAWVNKYKTEHKKDVNKESLDIIGGLIK